jgi:hypothetical protein
MMSKLKKQLKLSVILTLDPYSKTIKNLEESLISENSMKDLALRSLLELSENSFGLSALKQLEKKMLSLILFVQLKSMNNIKMV